MDRLPEIATMFAMMNDTGRDYLVGMARQLLRSFPNEASPSAAQNVDNAQLIDNNAHGTVYHFPLRVVRKPINRKKADLG